MTRSKMPLSYRGFFTIFMLVTLLTLSLPFTVKAQDPTNDFPNTFITHDGAFSFQYPSDWVLTLEDMDDFILLTNGDPDDSLFFAPDAEDSVIMLIVPPNQFGQLFPDIEDLPRTPRELLEVLIFEDGNADIFSNIEEGTLNGHRAVFANVEDDELSGQVFVLDLDDGDLVMVIAATISGEYSAHQETAISIVSTMTLHRYLPGDFRLVTSQSMRMAFEMPAEYFYDDSDDEGSLIFGSDEEVFNNRAPSAGEFMGIFATDQFLTDALMLDIEGFESPEHAIAVFSDSVIAEELDGVSFSELERLTFEDKPVPEMLQFTFTSDIADGVVVAFELDNGQIMVGAFIANSGELGDYEEVIAKITGSIQPLHIPVYEPEPDRTVDDNEPNVETAPSTEPSTEVEVEEDASTGSSE